MKMKTGIALLQANSGSDGNLRPSRRTDNKISGKISGRATAAAQQLEGTARV